MKNPVFPILSDTDLKTVEKPAQYLGGETGSITKDDQEIDLHVCLAFPDTYEVGMSHIGLQILYDLINRDPKIWAERAYVPRADMEQLLRKKNAQLGSIESRRPISEFDIVGFSLQYELCMNGVLGILDLGGVPLLAKDRSENDPIIIAGGPVCYHPEPLADFFDAFLIGDGEELVPEFLARVQQLKQEGKSRSEILLELRHIQGIYIPSLFEPQYSQTGKFLGMKPLLEDYTAIRRRIISTLENAPYPENPIVPNIEAVHDRLSVEVMRGCVRGCRFCQAGYLYRPQRERSPEEIINIVEKSLKNTGYEELSLLSLSTADYCSILPLLSSIKERFAENDDLAVSFPSTRVDALKPELLQEVQPMRRSGFTIAPEAGTQRLRDVINKGVTEEELYETCSNVFRLGWNSIKMYFMIGLPTETDEDIEAIAQLGINVKKIAGKKRQVTVSVSTHVPKPHTPFQWAEQITESETIRKQQILRDALKKHGVNFRYHNSFSTFLEGVFARGDRQLGTVILKAYQLGARLDGWVEELSPETWAKAFEECGIDPHHYLHERHEDDALPWDHISCDIPKRYFLKEWKRSVASRVTPDCLTQSCSVCGACDYDATRNVLFNRERTEKRLGIEDPPWQKIIDQREKSNQQSTDLNQLLSPEDQQSSKKTPSPEKEGTYSLREYLRTETDTSRNSGVPDRTVIPIAQRVRLQYTRLGKAAFTAHLDLAKIFFRAARKQNIPVAYSRGFHPKPRFSFGPPLQLGLESEAEYVDIFLTEQLEIEDLTNRFNSGLPEGMQVVRAESVPLKTLSIQASAESQQYRANLTEKTELSSKITQNWESKVVERTRKGKTKSVILGDIVDNLNIDGDQILFSVKSNGNAASLKPGEVITGLFQLPPEKFSIRKLSTTILEDIKNV